ncbi:hypothetical protein L3X38_012599 [Prunus dulcis]|uniref:Uncharacterized protein n=1 Tax=Prunus dulcis TaxID=3755 RepID=A0AAD4ZFD5_PRUDU|nr:hypothetical protein L3X38_012599 [Prunus dulcis]
MSKLFGGGGDGGVGGGGGGGGEGGGCNEGGGGDGGVGGGGGGGEGGGSGGHGGGDGNEGGAEPHTRTTQRIMKRVCAGTRHVEAARSNVEGYIQGPHTRIFILFLRTLDMVRTGVPWLHVEAARSNPQSCA